MPVYEYYCRRCESKFEKLRPVSTSSETAECPAGHLNAPRALSVFATFSSGALGETVPSGGGCCGGGSCACGASRN